jgi:uncharacterized protein with PQ loop repeat
MQIEPTKYKDYLVCLLLFCLIQLWTIPHTIAARYVCEALLLILLFSSRLEWSLFLHKSKLIVLFLTYLLIQLFFFSTDLNAGFKGFKSEWMHFIVFSVIGAGIGLYFAKQKTSHFLVYLGLAFLLVPLVHLVLSFLKFFEAGAIPWGYWGINDHHADLGYKTLLASIFLSTYLFFETKKKLLTWACVLLLVACIASPLIAQSRGGVIFVLLSLLFVFLIFIFIAPSRRSFRLKDFFILTMGLVFVGLIIKSGVSADPNRWGGMISRALVGFHGDPNLVYCNGIDNLRNALHQEGIAITPQIEAGIKSVEDGDGARVMAARSGLLMALENPMGINGSKQAYQTAITQFCQKPPAIFIPHTHNGWIDTALAIGILGALLLLLIMLNYATQGFRMIKSEGRANPFAIALFVSAVIWILRGILDSTLRDHMLEMQAFTFALLLVLAILFHKKHVSNLGLSDKSPNSRHI